VNFVKQHFPHFDAVEIFVMASGALIFVTLVFAM
jgi:hypothetical protein